MPLRNKDGSPVDPVPFLLVTVIGFTVSFSFGPPYFLALGVELPRALVICGVLVVVVGGIAYHRYVRTARSGSDVEISGQLRLERLFYAVLVGVFLIVLLALPLLVSLR